MGALFQASIASAAQDLSCHRPRIAVEFRDDPVGGGLVGDRVQRLAPRVFDLLGPDILDGRHDIGGHRHEVEIFGHLAALE